MVSQAAPVNPDKVDISSKPANLSKLFETRELVHYLLTHKQRA